MARIFRNLNGLSLTRHYPITALQNQVVRNCTTNPKYSLHKKKSIHPYRNIHPWKSVEEFSKHLLANVIYNEDGLVAVNKPYGVSKELIKHNNVNEQFKQNGIANATNYTLNDSLQYLASSLGYKELMVVKSPERYMSGIALYAANSTVKEKVIRCSVHASSIKKFSNTYWIITTKLPKIISGNMRLAIGLEYSSDRKIKKPVILHKWTMNSVRNQTVKLLNVDFKLLGNSTGNFASLIEVTASTRRWHALRLFAATVLYSPILGDNMYGSRVQKVMDTWLLANPFTALTNTMPRLDKELLHLLHLTSSKQELIPAHIHLKDVYLPGYLRSKQDLTISSTLPPYFEWTYKQLLFKNGVENHEAELGHQMNESSDNVYNKVIN